MGLFGKQAGQAADDPSADLIADKKYREELRQIGREQFKQIVSEQAGRLEKEVDEMMEQVVADLRAHIARRVDALMGRLNAEVTNQLNDRIHQYNQATADAQELVAQSLSQNAQMVHEKYQQLAMNMQQIVANQEVVMATVFQDNKTMVANVQAEQAKTLEQLKENEAQTRQESEQLTRSLRESVTKQSEQLQSVYSENMASVEQTREVQAKTLESLKQSADALETQHKELSKLLDESIANQKSMTIDAINENMARIIEHYLIGALGEQSSLREQLPSILERMEENKQAMADDMKL